MPGDTKDTPPATPHPLARMVLDAAAGRFPVPDGGWHRVAPWRPGIEAVVAFTGHAVFCLEDDVEDAVLETLGADGLGGAHTPRLAATLTGPEGWVDSLDVLLVHRPGAALAAPGDAVGPGPALVERPELAGEPRARFAALRRDDLTVYGYADPTRSAVAVVGRGIGGLRELSYELEPDRRGRREGAALVHGALRAAGAGTPLVACVAPGNVASLRLLLACGFAPVASVQLVRRRPGYSPSRPGHSPSRPG